jgi:pimeloyl-ACP methyl ester carboxylesterase
MPIAKVNGVNVHYDQYGSGEPVILVTGTGSTGRSWTPHQVPALTAAGYRVITIDNRGVPPTDVGPAGFTVADMVADTVGLIEYLGIAPCRAVGFSLGGLIVQESLLAHPDAFSQAVLMASRGRTDALRAALSKAWTEFDESGATLLKYQAVMNALQYLSPRTLNDEQRVQDWLDMFEMAPSNTAIGLAQSGLDVIDNRLEDYRKIGTDCLVISFQDDVVVAPFFGREISEAIPDCRYALVPDCGHYGHLEDPDAVNSLIIEFFRNPWQS